MGKILSTEKLKPSSNSLESIDNQDLLLQAKQINLILDVPIHKQLAILTNCKWFEN